MQHARSFSEDSGCREERAAGVADPEFVPDDIAAVTKTFLKDTTLLVQIKQLSSHHCALGSQYDGLRAVASKSQAPNSVVEFHLDKTPFKAMADYRKQQQQESTQQQVHRKRFLFVSGGHGRLRAPFAFAREVPSYWASRIIDPLHALGVRFDVILLDYCYSASAMGAAHFGKLLTPETGVLIAHASTSNVCISAHLLELLGKEQQRQEDAIPVAEFESAIRAGMRLLPRQYFSDFFFSRATEVSDRGVFAKIAHMVAEAAAGELQLPAASIEQVTKLLELHTDLMHREFEYPASWSPLVRPDKKKEDKDKEEEETKKKKEEEDSSKKPKLPPPPFRAALEERLLFRRIRLLSLFLQSRFPAVFPESRIALLLAQLEKVREGLTAHQQQHQKEQEQQQEQHQNEDEEAAAAATKKEKRRLLDAHWQVQTVINKAVNMIWDSPIALQQGSSAALRQLLHKTQDTFPLTSLVAFSAGDKKLLREDVIHTAGSLISLGTASEEKKEDKERNPYAVDDEEQEEAIVAEEQGQYAEPENYVARPLSYDHDKCAEWSSLTDAATEVDSRRFEDTVMKLVCAALEA